MSPRRGCILQWWQQSSCQLRLIHASFSFRIVFQISEERNHMFKQHASQKWDRGLGPEVVSEGGFLSLAGVAETQLWYLHPAADSQGSEKQMEANPRRLGWVWKRLWNGEVTSHVHCFSLLPPWLLQKDCQRWLLVTIKLPYADSFFTFAFMLSSINLDIFVFPSSCYLAICYFISPQVWDNTQGCEVIWVLLFTVLSLFIDWIRGGWLSK